MPYSPWACVPSKVFFISKVEQYWWWCLSLLCANRERDATSNVAYSHQAEQVHAPSRHLFRTASVLRVWTLFAAAKYRARFYTRLQQPAYTGSEAREVYTTVYGEAVASRCLPGLYASFGHSNLCCNIIPAESM